MKHMTSLPLALLMGALLTAPGLAAQEALWERVQEAYSAQGVEQIREVVERAAAQGVPAEPILDKALEGAVKGYPPGLVLQVLPDYATRLGEAGALLGRPATPAELVATADALRRGVPEESVRQLAAGPGDAAAALVALGDLVEMGVPVGTAHEVVTEALARGTRGDDLLSVPTAVRRLIREGVIPAEAAARVQQGLARGGSPGQIPSGGLPFGLGAAPPVSPPIPPGAGPPDIPGRPPGTGGPPGGIG